MNNTIIHAIEALSTKHRHAIAIFGGAYHAVKHNNDMDKFVDYLPHVVQSAKFYNWHEGVVGALRTFCHLCFVDPALVECYIGARFEEFERG